MKLITSFLDEERTARNFSWVELDSEKTKRMDADYLNSLDAIKKYLDDWLVHNYQDPVRAMSKKRKFILRRSNVKNAN